jgi:hypothetical protein
MKASRNKIYLSKSNIASVENVREVREHLQSLGYEIVEHDGGSYDPHPMLGCKYMIMVGYDMNEDNDLLEVGKGQYQQLEFREANGFDYTDNLYFTGTRTGRFEFYEVETSMILDANSWKKGYGEIQLVEEAFLDGVVEARSEPTTRVTDPQTMEIVDRMEAELPDGLFSNPFHLACINLLE